MTQYRLLRRWAMNFCLAAVFLCAAGPVSAQVPLAKSNAAKSEKLDAPALPMPACVIPEGEVRFERPLPRTSQRIAAGQPVKIVAIGSSSTSGAGASSDQMTYPSRLAAYLADDFPNNDFTVVNRGVSGETAPDMLARFDAHVFAEKPDLVIWQVGTNSLLRDHPMKPHLSLLEAGLVRLQAAGTDIVLMDPQYAPRVIAKPNAPLMVAMVARAAKEKSINVFHRFALMRHWREVVGIPFRAFLSRDQLHMNDWSYACVARALGRAIAETTTRSPAIVQAVRASR
jgi:lysophospholipase L1-like esterase